MQSLISFRLTNKLLSTDSTVTISNIRFWGGAAVFTDESLLFTTDDGTSFEMCVGTAAGGSLTLTKRGLDASNTKVEVFANKKDWGAGTLVYVAALASDLLDKDSGSTQTISGNLSFTGNNTHSGTEGFTNNITISGANGGLDMSAAGNPLTFPSFTTTQRLALIPVVGMVVYDSTIGQLYQYTSTGWNPFQVGVAVVTNATTAAAGITQLATTAQYLAGTATGSTGAGLTATPDMMASTRSFDAVVATSGGNYTTVTAAINAGKRSILVRAGNYTETEWMYGTDSNLSVIGEGNVNITFNNTSSSAEYIKILGNGYFRGLNFLPTLNATRVSLIANNTGSGYQSKKFLFDNCNISVSESAANTYLCKTITRTTFNNCYIYLNNSGGHTIYLDYLGNTWLGCTFQGYLATFFQGSYIGCAIDVETVAFGSSSLFSGCVSGSITTLSGTIGCISDCFFSISATGDISIQRSSSSFFDVGAATVKLLDSISSSYIKSTGDITFSGCHITGCEIQTSGKYLQDSSSQITGNVIRNGTEFKLTTSYNVISGNRFIGSSVLTINSGSTYNSITGNTSSVAQGITIVAGGNYNVITGNSYIGTITDGGTSNIKANNN